MPSPSRRLSSAAVCWPLLWVLLGTIHVTQAIWTSGFSALPADLGDGRFNHLVLEHGYLSWRGVYEWLSPGQFYPTTHTLGWSDTHLGTLPIYIIARIFGANAEHAMQVWYLVCAGANMLAGIALLRRLGVDRRWAPPLAVGAFGGLPMAWATGTHPQLLPIFPALWAAQHGVAWFQTREGWRWFAITGGLAWQFAAAPYLAFFTGLLATLAFGLGRIIGVNSETGGQSRGVTGRRVKFCHLMLAGVGLVAGGVSLWIYSQARGHGVSRPLNELAELAPTLGAWFAAPRGHWLYPAGWPGGEAAADERLLLGGFLPWIGAVFALALGFKRSATAPLRLAAALTATALVTVLVFTTWPGEISLWLTLAEVIEPLRAFRAAGRIAGLVHALLFTATGLLLWTWAKAGHPRLATALIATLLLETVAIDQHRTPVADLHARRDAIVQAWAEAGDHPVLAWAPGYTNQSTAALHLDAWAAAMATGRVTVNGYSGWTPASHQLFYWSPNAANASALVGDQNLDPATASIVTTLDAAAAKRTGYEFFTSRSLQHLEGFDLQPSAWDLLVAPERFAFEGTVFYQFTPNAKVTFRLPDEVGTVSLLTGPRPGSWSDGGNSDGYDLRWRVVDADGSVLSQHAEVINPRDQPTDRGFQARVITAPTGIGRRLILETGPGPSGLNNWDWPLFGRLRVAR